MFGIKPEAVCHVIFKARILHGSEGIAEETDEMEVPAEELLEKVAENIEVHEEHEHDPVYNELKTFLAELLPEEQYELIALAWLGRGDGFKDDWEGLRRLAQERHTQHTPEYLLGMPQLADYLEDALEQFDISCEDFEDEHQ